MKIKLVLIFVLTLYFTKISSQITQRFNLDFGPNDITNGNNTLSPDINGNFWTNISPAPYQANQLSNSQNRLSNFYLTLYTGVASGGLLNGGLFSPESDKLGDMAIATATQDFIYATTPVKMKLRGLNINNGYKFYFFASRDNTSNRITNFDVQGINASHGTLKTSGTNLGGIGKNYNNNTFYVTDTIRPDITGEIVIDMSPGVGGSIYLNMMKIEEISIIDISSIELSGNNISISNDSSQMSLNFKPSNASNKLISWSVDDTTLAVIKNNGLLIAKKNGVVNVSALISQNGSTLSASKNIYISNQFSNLMQLQRLYLDFGVNDITNGNNTLNPSINGNYWNNINPTGTTKKTDLINSANQSSGFNISYNSTLSSLGILHGGLLNPEVLKLGDMAVATATQDFFYTFSSGNMTFGGLNKSKAYRFTIFGSRDYSDVRKTTYTLNGLNSCVGILQSSGKDIGGIGKNYNNSQFYTSELLIPDNNGDIKINISVLVGAAAYVNMMKIEEFLVDYPTSLVISGDSIDKPFGESKMNCAFLPQNSTPFQIMWAVDDTTIASINSKGLLIAKQNGIVNVVASCILPNGQIIKSSKIITLSNQITDLYIGGSAIMNGVNQKSALKMNKVIDLSGLKKGFYELSTTLKSSGTFSFFTSQAPSDYQKFGLGESIGLIKADGQSISAGVSGEALIRIDLLKKTYVIYPIDTTKLTLMGSSVGFGIGATSNHGWFYQYVQLLSQRYLSNDGSNWITSNISIPGNNTTLALDRWDSDLLNEGSKYVIYGVSLGNEGILGGGQPVFDQFRRNVAILIAKARSAGKIPVLTNCYGRNDFTVKEYNYIKQMNIILAQLDLPSFNLLGALDNGTGSWPIEYRYDIAHPNDLGHTELSYVIVPSLFEALKNKKQIPHKISGTYLTLGKDVTTLRIAFTPESKIHSFTTSFDIRTNSTGIVSTFMQSDSVGLLKINETGTLSYVSPNGGYVTSSQIINDGNWHKITLTHYYAWGMTILYTDTIVAGNLSEKVLAQSFIINNKNAPNRIDYKDWLFYRSAMNADEINELNHGKLLKSSLELYSPLDGLSLLSADTLINLAQSMNKLKLIDTPTSLSINNTESQIKLFPNPVTTKLQFSNMDTQKGYSCKVYSIDGKMIINKSSLSKNELDVSNLRPNKYILLLFSKQANQILKFEFLKK